MSIIYSIGARFGGGGIGSIAAHQAISLYREGLLERLLCGSFCPTEIPATRISSPGLPSRALRRFAASDRSRRLWYLESVLYDAWATTRLQAADLFYVWSGYGLRSLQRARRMGMVAVLKHASTHPLYQARLLKEEFARWGLVFRIPESALRRVVAEMAQAEYVLIPSEFVRRSFLNEGFPESRLLQVPFGVDTGRFRPAAGAYGRHPFRVLFVGQIGIRKGVPYLLETWRRLRWHDAELWLVGRVDPASRQVIKEAGDLPGVRFAGYASDPVSLYQQADAFAFPSIEEGSALVTYEALACGLPVVTTPNAGSVVRDSREGFIVPIRDVDALGTQLEQLRSDESLRREMGRAARQRAELFTWERCNAGLCSKLARLAGVRASQAL